MPKCTIIIVSFFAGVCAAQTPAADAGVTFKPGSSISFDANGKLVKIGTAIRESSTQRLSQKRVQRKPQSRFKSRGQSTGLRTRSL